VLLQASDGEIRLTTTDLDVGIRGSVEAQVARTGATTLPARRLLSIVRELPSSEIYFDVDTKNLASIRSGSSYFKILGLPEEEFPSLARFEEAKIFAIAQKALKDGLKKTSYAMSVDETRYVLNGILFSFKDNKLTLVATDGRRLALVDLEVEFPSSQETEIIVSTKAVTEIERLLREEGEVNSASATGAAKAPIANPSSGLKKISPMSIPQKPPLTAPYMLAKPFLDCSRVYGFRCTRSLSREASSLCA